MWSSETLYEKFKKIINWVLISLDESISIQRFSCYGCSLDDYTFNTWINLLVQRDVKELDLKILLQAPKEFPDFLINIESFVKLKLQVELYHVLHLPNISVFRRLKSLDLVRVELLSYKLFQNFVSSCSFLENLEMEGCIFHDFKILDMSGTSLKLLTIHNDGFSDMVALVLKNVN